MKPLVLWRKKFKHYFFKHGYNLIICNTSYDENLEKQALGTMIMKKVDAIILVATTGNSSKIKEIIRRGIPVLLLDRLVKGLEADSVVVDNFRGSYEIVNYLIQLGHREIGYIDRKTFLSHSIDQRKGYISGLKDNNIEIKDSNVVIADGYSYDSGYKAAQQLLKNNPKITAIFGYYDVIAFGAMRAIKDMGYQIPKDFSIVGYDSMPFTRFAYPSLTTVSFPVEELAISAVDLVIERLEEKDKKEEKNVIEPKKIIITPKLVIGETTDIARLG